MAPCQKIPIPLATLLLMVKGARGEDNTDNTAPVIIVVVFAAICIAGGLYICYLRSKQQDAEEADALQATEVVPVEGPRKDSESVSSKSRTDISRCWEEPNPKTAGKVNATPVVPLQSAHLGGPAHLEVPGSTTSHQWSESSGVIRRHSSRRSAASWTGRQGPSRDIVLQTLEEEEPRTVQAQARRVLEIMQQYSIPLISGVTLALVWSNVHMESYHDFIETQVHPDAVFEKHGITLHFLVNDIFMCFFFGLAIKEVTEALLPGGSLNPLRRAINPLLATLGGVFGPVLVYLAFIMVMWEAGIFDGYMCQQAGESSGGHRRLGGGGGDHGGNDTADDLVPCTSMDLLWGWGVPTATDISLAWMFAVQIFGDGHPAINFLLLLAIADDAIGMVIIAVFYPDPLNPVQPLWLLLTVSATALALVLRMLKVRRMPIYIFVCGPISWYGLIKSHVHPALALVVVVPLMPASHAVPAHGPHDLGAVEAKSQESPEKSHAEAQTSTRPFKNSEGRSTLSQGLALLLGTEESEAPLHKFEEWVKLPVDLGLFFFGLANAGVELGGMGGVTVSIFAALLIGKTLGIAGSSLLAEKLGFGLPPGVTKGDVFAMAAIAGVGLTVALFVANEAFVDEGLKGQAKMGAVLSVVCGGVGWAFRRCSHRKAAQSESQAVDLQPGWNTAERTRPQHGCVV